MNEQIFITSNPLEFLNLLEILSEDLDLIDFVEEVYWYYGPQGIFADPDSPATKAEIISAVLAIKDLYIFETDSYGRELVMETLMWQRSHNSQDSPSSLREHNNNCWQQYLSDLADETLYVYKDYFAGSFDKKLTKKEIRIAVNAIRKLPVFTSASHNDRQDLIMLTALFQRFENYEPSWLESLNLD